MQPASANRERVAAGSVAGQKNWSKSESGMGWGHWGLETCSRGVRDFRRVDSASQEQDSFGPPTGAI